MLVTTGIGSTKQLRINKGTIGSRAVKPRSVINVGQRNRITGALRMMERPDVVDDEETDGGTPQQLTLLGGANGKSATKKGKKKK